MDLIKAGLRKQGRCYSKGEEARLPFNLLTSLCHFGSGLIPPAGALDSTCVYSNFLVIIDEPCKP